MKRIVTGILAHVDAGKTTLSEGLLYCAGEIRTLGRVDTRNTFLDTDEIERRRGITIFSKQAVLTLDDTQITLLDTPGHIDFSAEAERTLKVLDYGIMVISGTDGVQSHTKTLWDLLKKNNIPTFIFINKLDLSGADKNRVINELKESLSGNFVDFCDADKDALCENIAVCDETVMQSYLENGNLDSFLVKRAIKSRSIFPVFSGSALKMDGVESFLKAFGELTIQNPAPGEFGAKVFKIGQDDRGGRLTYMKITGGNLKVKDLIKTAADSKEKINEIRIYSGDKYQSADVVNPGCICAVTGLSRSYAGQGLGFEESSKKLTAEPIFTYRVLLPSGTDEAQAIAKLKLLEEEETQLNVSWNPHLKEIQLRVMGEIQLEVLKQLIFSRFGIPVEFEEGRIVYKETIETRVEGVGHYEPLKHYAEVHLLLEPLPRGSGLQFETDCSEDELDKNWQRLIMTHLMEKTHIGVLTASPITDIKITLKSGKAHLKHTEGGDFRQATYRAVRHGLRCAKSVLLEPYYDFTLEVPDENVGKAMTDLNFMGAEFSLPHSWGGTTKISGNVAADAIRNYHRNLIGYTHGKGKLSLSFRDYGPARNPQAVIESIGYNADSDTENTADSVFCSHGAGFTVKWDEVTKHMHLESVLRPTKPEKTEGVRVKSAGTIASDEELLKIFERTYGKVEPKNPNHAMRTPKSLPKDNPYKPKKKKEFLKEYLLVDGYNVIFAWDDLKSLAKTNLDAARARLTERLSAYRMFKECEIILVFDAYKVKGNTGEYEEVDGIAVVYTKEAQTADAYIEKTAKELSRNYKVTVATSDNLEQIIIFGSGAYRLSATALLSEVERTEESVRRIVEENSLQPENTEFLRTIREKMEELEKAREEE